MTTDSNQRRTVYPNLARTMVLTGMDQLWVADITYIRLREESEVPRSFSQRIPGFA